jgi:hypothetical protein
MSHNPKRFELFIDEILTCFSQLLLLSIDCVKEVTELNVVKNVLFQWNREILKEKTQLVRVNNDCVREINSLNYVIHIYLLFLKG